MEFIIKGFAAFLFGGYFVAIGFGLHTPKMKKKPTSDQLRKLRLAGKVAGIAGVAIGVINTLKYFGLW
jgi:hypothetical protein